MKPYVAKLFAFFFLIVSSDVHAQGLTYYQEVIPRSNLSDVKNHKPDVSDRIALNIVDRSVKVGFPMMFNDKQDIFINALTYKELVISYDGLDGVSEIDPPKKLNTWQYQLIYIHSFSAVSKLMLTGGLSRSSDENAASPSSQKYNGAVMLNHGEKKNQRYGYGLVFSHNFGEALLLPAFSYNSVGEYLTINLSFPNKFTVDYQVAPKTHAGFELIVNGDQYRLLENSTRLDIVRYARVTGGFYLLLGNRPGFSVKLGVGSTVLRRYQGYQNGEEVFNFDLENRPYYRLIVKFGF